MVLESLPLSAVASVAADTGRISIMRLKFLVAAFGPSAIAEPSFAPWQMQEAAAFVSMKMSASRSGKA